MDNTAYRQTQFDKLKKPKDDFFPKIKIVTSKGSTHYFPITHEELAQIEKILIN
jgi:hypothetical protein